MGKFTGTLRSQLSARGPDRGLGMPQTNDDACRSRSSGSIYPPSALLRVCTEFQFGPVLARFPYKCVAHAWRPGVLGPIRSTGGGSYGRGRNGILVRPGAKLGLF